MKNSAALLLFILVLSACNQAAKPAATAPKTNQAPNQEAVAFVCMGTEPFWSVEISEKAIVFQSPEIAPVSYPYVAPQTGDAGAVYITPPGGGKSGMKITITPGACSDGMSDVEYPYFVVVEREGQILRGCAREKQ